MIDKLPCYSPVRAASIMAFVSRMTPGSASTSNDTASRWGRERGVGQRQRQRGRQRQRQRQRGRAKLSHSVTAEQRLVSHQREERYIKLCNSLPTFLVEANGEIKGSVTFSVLVKDTGIVLEEFHESQCLASRAVLAGKVQRRVPFVIGQTNLSTPTHTHRYHVRVG